MAAQFNVPLDTSRVSLTTPCRQRRIVKLDHDAPRGRQEYTIITIRSGGQFVDAEDPLDVVLRYGRCLDLVHDLRDWLPSSDTRTSQREYLYEVDGIDEETSYILSVRPPEEVFVFGISADDLSRRVPTREPQYGHSAQQSVKEDQNDGLCRYCRLILSENVSEYTLHHASLHALFESRRVCKLCVTASGSLVGRHPELIEMYDQCYPLLFDTTTLRTAITVKASKTKSYFKLEVRCGNTDHFTFTGEPFIWTNENLLGHLSDRKIWQSHANQRGQPVDRLKIFSIWIKECGEKHDLCGPHWGPVPRLPTRVIEITQGDDKQPFGLRLVQPKAQRALYTALSYCWGKLPPAKTVKANLELHQRSIQFSSLPLTFQDAIYYSTLIGCQYVWIDSLCIIQDDESDWMNESTRMCEVYTNALVTFAATSGLSGASGLQYDYVAPKYVSTQHSVARIVSADCFNLDRDDAPLNQRGWAFQEGLMSPRLISFDEKQMLWKCSSKIQSENGLFDIDPQSSGSSRGKWNLSAQLHGKTSQHEMYSCWYRLMESYSKRSFSFEKDKLPALAGLTEAFGKTINDVPMVGLWRADMHMGLLWQTENITPRLHSLGAVPTWSWVSVANPVMWEASSANHGTSGIVNRLELLSCHIAWVSTPMVSPIQTAILKVRGRLYTALISNIFRDESNVVHLFGENDAHSITANECRTDSSPIDSTAATGSAPGPLVGFCSLEERLPKHTKVWCLEVSTMQLAVSTSGASRNHVHRVLVLLPTGSSYERFKRVGIGSIWKTPAHQGAGGSYKQEESTGPEVFKDIQPVDIEIV